MRYRPADGGQTHDDPPWLRAWLLNNHDVVTADSPEELVALLRRSRPPCVIIDARDGGAATAAVAACKEDPYTALVPCIVTCAASNLAGDSRVPALGDFLRAGADAVVPVAAPDDEAVALLDGAIRSARRNLHAQPTTGLPGPPAIHAELARRLRQGVAFAACYADLDHFKEFNDRYGFAEGDRVIRMVARLLHDVVYGIAGQAGFVGHIGGDDFLCVVPLADVVPICELVVELFDALAPLQYSAADRRAGYYLGKDRRGQLHRVPLMTISLGVATTERRRFRSPDDVSRLASEMKSFAKSRPGSVYAFDRRGDTSPESPVTAVPSP